MASINTFSPEFEERLHELWIKNNLALNISVIDMQHLWLLYLILRSEDIIYKSSGAVSFNDVKDILMDISEYITDHFDIEERLFQLFGYPEARNHKDHHDLFIYEFQNIFEQCKKGAGDGPKKLVPYLHNWLLNHIVKEDKIYQRYFLEKGPAVDSAIQKIISDNHIEIKQTQMDLYQMVTKKPGIFESTHKDIIEKIYSIATKFKLSIHVPIIDIQHMWILKLMLELDNTSHAFPVNQRKFFFERTVKLLQEYTKEHFFTEEIIMREFQYPEFARHVDEHRGFLEQVVKRIGQYKGGDMKVVSELAKDLKEWIFSHIALEDRQMGAFLAQKHRQVTDFVKEQIHQNKLILRRSQVNLYQQIHGIVINKGKKQGESPRNNN
jgi:hemerythrin-like metal-binding protein